MATYMVGGPEIKEFLEISMIVDLSSLLLKLQTTPPLPPTNHVSCHASKTASIRLLPYSLSEGP